MKNNFHNAFLLNGISFSCKKELLDYTQKKQPLIYRFLLDWFSTNDYIIVQTSGSTGTPKKIKLKKTFMINSAKATGKFFNLPEKTTALLCLSVDYIAGKMMLVRALILGWHLDIMTPSSSITIKKHYDFSAMVPLQLRNAQEQLHYIKKIIVGGGVVEVDLIQQIQPLKTIVFATYGMTETITHIAVKKLNHLHVQPTFYEVLPNVKIYKNRRNCLLIKAPKVSDATIITNDVVQLVSDTQFEWLGRFDNVINSGGIKLHPEIIEKKLATIIKNRFFVTGLKDEILGEKLVLIIEENTKLNKEVLKTKIAAIKTLTKYEIPKDIYFVVRFIETETKKIQRKETVKFIFN